VAYKAKAHIEDGQVLCASTNCEGCDFEYYNKCVEVEITEKSNSETQQQDDK